ncbi:hypothetical protein LOAG_15824 [Loa loa]|uniref:Uncharacterized protein n=1 Tax=Loa loa TaxID=7209 RepID=A0A1S0TEV2_LOALO|nr:hypothetical protein LOAG_15824 [Loa loa]EFO12709.1 hypothetical protein LOAG_15824 [Loa loa]
MLIHDNGRHLVFGLPYVLIDIIPSTEETERTLNLCHVTASNVVENSREQIHKCTVDFVTKSLEKKIIDDLKERESFETSEPTIFQSDMNDFNFPTELYFDLWGLVDDYRNGRLGKVEMPAEKIATDEKLLSNEQKH